MLTSFKKAYRLRNRIVHQGDRDCVTNSDMEEFGVAVTDFLQADIHRTPDSTAPSRVR